MNHGNAWVCLLYHNIGIGPTRPSGGPEHFDVPIEIFRDQLALIRSEGFAGKSIAQQLASPDDRSVALSFDDGEFGLYQHAFPLLAEYGMKATFFITTSWVGTPGYMGWGHLRELNEHGMSIQSHTHSHPFLSSLTHAELQVELSKSKSLLDDKLGQDTDEISLPNGDAPPSQYREMLWESGYRRVSTSRWGVNRPEPTLEGLVFIARCTLRASPPLGYVRGVIYGSKWLALRKYARGSALGAFKSTVGPKRYDRWRQAFLNRVGGIKKTSGGL